MTGHEMRAIREHLGLSIVQFGVLLGSAGSINTLVVRMREYERGKRLIPETVARLVVMFSLHGYPPQWLSDDPAQVPTRVQVYLTPQ